MDDALESGSIEVWVQDQDQVASMYCVLMQNNLLSLSVFSTQDLFVQCWVKITQGLCEILFQIWKL